VSKKEAAVEETESKEPEVTKPLYEVTEELEGTPPEPQLGGSGVSSEKIEAKKEAPDASEMLGAVFQKFLEMKTEIDGMKRREEEKDKEERIMTDRVVRSEWERQQESPHTWITIHRVNDEDHEAAVYVGANGVSYWLKKEERIPVPAIVLDVLRNAESTITYTAYDEEDGHVGCCLQRCYRIMALAQR